MASTASMRSAAFGTAVRAAPRSPFRAAVVAPRAPVVVQALADKPKGKKRTDPAVKRALLGKERRRYNKARKSACATRVKKVLKAASVLLATPPTSEEEVKPLEKLIAEAYSEIDKAVTKDVLHKNNAARKKARIARWKRTVLLTAGLWVPPADHPDHGKYVRAQAKKEGAAQ